MFIFFFYLYPWVNNNCNIYVLCVTFRKWRLRNKQYIYTSYIVPSRISDLGLNREYDHLSSRISWLCWNHYNRIQTDKLWLVGMQHWGLNLQYICAECDVQACTGLHAASYSSGTTTLYQPYISNYLTEVTVYRTGQCFLRTLPKGLVQSYTTCFKIDSHQLWGAVLYLLKSDVLCLAAVLPLPIPSSYQIGQLSLLCATTLVYLSIVPDHFPDIRLMLPTCSISAW